MGIYSRLSKYRDTPSLSQAENFLTEALADLFNRFPLQIRIEFLVQMLPSSCSDRLRNRCKDGKQIEALTQVSLGVAGFVKRPDMIVYVDSKPLILLEVKIDAALQKDQLKTYSVWMGSKCSGDWPGAVVFLTHRTRAPDGFENDGREGNSVIGVTRTWKYIGDWLVKNLDLNQSETTHCALASDFSHFLERQGLMTDFMTSRHLAATELFMPAYQALRHTFLTVIREIALKYPKSKGGNPGAEFWMDNSYVGWYYLNNSFNPDGSKFSISVGIWFPDQNGALGSDNPVGLPRHEPFFFIRIGDDRQKKKVCELLSKTPEGWVETNEDYSVIVTRAVSQFDADPDVRVQSLIAWAQEEVGRAVACIPNFDSAPVENISEDSEG